MTIMPLADASSRTTSPPRPELLAPAGDFDCARAAVENGADAVYFGLRLGMNARARAKNFSPEELAELMAYLHLRGVKGYVTLNTLVFPDEWEPLESAVRLAVSAGVDAVLVQDLGAARFIRALCPDWPLHASTQMSLTSAENIRVAESLGISRVVLARELSLDEIRQVRRDTRVELEVFVHGALCISYSGQCLASLTMGGRSGNRGQCAQPCRLPYQLVGQTCPAQYPLSPTDLAALDLMPELIAAGVDALKIEGRLKSAEYVAAVTRQYRRAIDEALAGRRLQLTPQEVEELEVSFSRGFSHGWLEGRNPRLVPGQGSAKRGVLVGTVRAVRGGRVTVELAGPIKRGDGMVFEGDRSEEDEQGGRVYGVFRRGRPLDEPVDCGLAELSFGNEAIDMGKLRPGQKAWKTDDPQIARRLRRSYTSGRPQRRVPLDIVAKAAVGCPLQISARAGVGTACRVESSEVLQEALKHPLTIEVLREQFGRLGGTVYELRGVEARIDGRPMVPLSVLGRLRHELVEALDAAATRPPSRALASVDVRPRADHASMAPGGNAVVHVLCRSLEQLEAVLAAGASSVIAELRDIHRNADAIRMARARGADVLLATPRIQKPGEMHIVERLLEYRPDGLLVRNLAGAAFCAARGMPFVADFSLNAVNEWTVAWLRDLGARRVTAAYDLGCQQLLDLASLVEPERLEVIVYGHVPMFHTEHCIVGHACSVPKESERTAIPPEGRRPEACPRRDGTLGTCPAGNLRDRRGVEHPLRTDVCCRNTLYHAEPRNITRMVPELLARGVRHFRVELLDGVPSDEAIHLLSSESQVPRLLRRQS
jgi:U32 family peptidase